MFPKHLHAQQLLLMLMKKGIENVIISPGSRNAPLILGFANNPYFKCYSIVDERCAAHVALGMAQQLRKPVAMVCTSGSALLNYYPAIAEAFYSEIPLIVISADRPVHKIDIADGQTIRQQHVFANHILEEIQLVPLTDTDTDAAIILNEDKLNTLLNAAIHNNGPVHINIPFEEPLYEMVEEAQIIVNSTTTDIAPIKIDIDDFLIDYKQSLSKLVIISTLYKDALSTQDLDLLLSDPSVLVMSEVSANVIHPKIIWSIDTLIAPMELDSSQIQDLNPDLVITIGGMIVSKKIKQFLRKVEGLTHYHIGENKAYDTFFALKSHIALPPSELIELLPKQYESSDYQSYWVSNFHTKLKSRNVYLNQIQWSDFKAFDLIFKDMPADRLLQLGNSSTIRYAQLFPMNDSHVIFSNRGTSGIDGCTSTAVGAAIKSHLPCIFVTGDISFFYDSNALWNNYIPNDFKIILINNSGGGIFRILPGHRDSEEFDTFFETKHNLDASHLCKMFNVDYHRVEEESAFAKAYSKFLNNNDNPQLIEIFTPNEVNEAVLLNYFKFLR
jgi:2-succinyl-5-enolpyruvyl-6-hydroxy-3-cyclohexene-1-carboxylate synthase